MKLEDGIKICIKIFSLPEVKLTVAEDLKLIGSKYPLPVIFVVLPFIIFPCK